MAFTVTVCEITAKRVMRFCQRQRIVFKHRFIAGWVPPAKDTVFTFESESDYDRVLDKLELETEI